MNNPLGANWKSTLTGAISNVLGAIVTGSLVFPTDFHNPRQIALFVCVILATAFGIQFANQTKSKDVTGGTVQQDAAGQVAVPQVATPMPPVPALPDLPVDVPKVVKVKLTKKVKPKIKVPPRIT
jgi:hypothetical protein